MEVNDLIPKIVHQGERFIVIDKPSGMLSVPGKDRSRANATDWARDQFGTAFETHRLDMSTSGLMIIALDKETERCFKMQFQNREIKKRYRAIVHGQLSTHSGVIDLPLRCDWPNRPRQMVCHEEGKPSQTEYRLIKQSESVSEVELTPITGRSHQLRVHLQAIGHPIVGDELYATDYPSLAPRLLLQADQLQFILPDTTKELLLELAPDFRINASGAAQLN